MDLFSRSFRLECRDVSMYGRLRPSAFLQFFQEIAADHASSLGFGFETTSRNNVMWIIIKNRVLFHRLPSYAEHVTLSTWIAPKRHVMFPRYAKLVSENGDVLVQSASYWSLVDFNTRSLAFSDEIFSIEMPDQRTGDEIGLPGRLRIPEAAESRTFSVPYDCIDLNRHMNNVRYVDIVENFLGLSAKGRDIKELTVEYVSEARLGDELAVSWALKDDAYYINGKTADRSVFDMMVRY